MKIQPRQTEQFIKRIPDNIRAVLVYGPDRGLIQERCKIISDSVLKGNNDTFNISVIDEEKYDENPAVIIEEAMAISLMGGIRLVQVRSAGDKLSATLSEYLKSPNSSSFVLVDSGELPPKSSLRKLFENNENAAAVPCYVEEERDLISLIANIFNSQGYKADRDVLTWLASNLKGDRKRVTGEIEKLMLYMGNEKHITLSDAENCCGEVGESSIDDLVYAIGDRNIKDASNALSVLSEQGIEPIIILRSMQNHFKRLHSVKSHIKSGKDMEGALKTLYPPIFFKVKNRFISQVNSWSFKDIEKVMSIINKTEIMTKTTGYDPDTICKQSITDIYSISRST